MIKKSELDEALSGIEKAIDDIKELTIAFAKTDFEFEDITNFTYGMGYLNDAIRDLGNARDEIVPLNYLAE